MDGYLRVWAQLFPDLGARVCLTLRNDTKVGMTYYMCVCANIIGTGNHGTCILLNIYRGKYFAVIAT